MLILALTRFRNKGHILKARSAGRHTSCQRHLGISDRPNFGSRVVCPIVARARSNQDFAAPIEAREPRIFECVAPVFQEIFMSAGDSAFAPVADFAAVKIRQQAAWSTGDYAVVGTTLQIVGENLCEALDLRAGSRVLDVAAGNGNATLAAARRWCDVTSTDYVASLLDSGRARAQAEGLRVQFQEADAEALPYADASFDIVMSTFGVMFSPDQEKAAAELARVCKSGGWIGLANWTPDSFIGKLFKTIGKYIPPPAGVNSPALWGTKTRLDELFDGTSRKITAISRDFTFRYRSSAHFIEVFRTFYGPMNKAFSSLEGERQAAFLADLITLIEDGNRSNDATLVLPSEYLEVVVERM
ncbi:ubiquinone/menaquinone biosynthesis C-methylase UbiE [Paraburkholderia sp. Clong3]